MRDPSRRRSQIFHKHGFLPNLPPPGSLRSVYNRTVWRSLEAVLLAITLVAAGAGRTAQFTLTWVDNSGGTAHFIIERKTGMTGTYVPIVKTGTGITTYTDPAVSAGTAYCYRVKALNASGESGYSNEACASK
jgi:hypothetical protein